MGKLYLTNVIDWANVLDDIYFSAGFKKSAYSKNNFISSFYKLCSSTPNFYSKNECSVYCSGTLLYKSSFGEKALESLLDDYLLYGITYVKSIARGSFAVIIMDSDDYYIFVDNIGTYSFYYYKNNESFLFSNMFSHVQKCVKQKVNKEAFLEWSITFCIINNESPFENIYRVLGDEIIHLSVSPISYEHIHCNVNHEVEKKFDKNKIISFLTQEFDSYNICKKSFFDNNAVFITGGLDSRLVLASNEHVGIKPECHYWGGKSALQNLSVSDLETGKQLSEIIGSKYIFHNISGDFVYQESDDDYYNIMGDYSYIYGGNSKLIEVFKSFKDKTFVDFGYFGELLTSWDNLDSKWHDSYTLNEFVNEVYWNRFNCVKKCDKHIKDRIYEEFNCLAQKHNMDCAHLTKDNCMLLYSYYRIHADVVMCNFSNMFCYNYILIGQPEVFSFVNSIDYKIKQGAWVSIALTNNLCEKLGSVQYYSHGVFRKVNKNNMFEDIKEDNHIIKKRIKTIMKKLVGGERLNQLLNILAIIRGKMGNKNMEQLVEDRKTIDYCKEELNKYRNILDIDWLPTYECYVSYIVSPLIMTRMISSYCLENKQ